MSTRSAAASGTRADALPESTSRRSSARLRTGFALIQVLISMGLVAMCGAAGIISLIQLNKKAVAVRTLNNARAVVQRNIDNALGVPFSITVQPAILGITTASGAVYDDDGGGDNLVNIVIPRSTGAVVKGTLTRIVLAEANADGADIRRITFRVDYTLRSRPYTFSMTTLRAMD